MKLRTKVIRNSTLITLTMMIAILAACRYILLDSYAALENRHLGADLHRTQRALDADLQSLDRVLQDYATWDKTYRLAVTLNSTYGDSDLTEVALRILKVRTALVMNRSGKIVFSKSVRREGESNESQSDLDLLMKMASRCNRDAGEHALTGMLMLADGPVLVAVRKVFSSSGAGPSVGSMLMIRDLDQASVAQLSSSLRLKVELTDVRQSDPRDLAALVDSPGPGGNFSTRILASNRIAALSFLKDVRGEPRFLLRIEHDREIWNKGLRALQVLAVSIFLFGLVFCILTIWCGTRTVVSRLERMIRFIRSVDTDSNLSARIHMDGHDEIAQLAGQINTMLDEIQHSHQDVLAARERLQFEATHDALTGAWNRAAALELLDREMVRSTREHSVVAVIMLDADHFKEINDRYGHTAGDVVLQNIAAAISRNLRASDVLARYGGEEFLIVAPNCSMEEARSLTARILSRLGTTPIHLGEEVVQVTLSAGITAGATPHTAEELIGLADNALYRAKNAGRNRVECEEVPDGASVKRALYAMPRRSV